MEKGSNKSTRGLSLEELIAINAMSGELESQRAKQGGVIINGIREDVNIDLDLIVANNNSGIILNLDITHTIHHSHDREPGGTECNIRFGPLVITNKEGKTVRHTTDIEIMMFTLTWCAIIRG